MSEIHFEVFVRRGKKGGWTLLEAITDRQAAIKRAQGALGQGGVVAVKVTKETYKGDDGTFQSVSVFHDGPKDKDEDKQEKPFTPCFKPQDLLSCHSRSVIARVLKGTLDEWQLIPMELVHRGDMLEKLEATSTVLQHAVQQVAIAQAADTPGKLHEIFRQLMDLALRAMDKVVQDERKGHFIPLPNGSVAAFWKEMGKKGEAPYLLAGAIANHIKNAQGWGTKLRFLLELLADLPEDEASRNQCLEVIDSFVAEMIRSPASLHDLLGECADLGAALRLMTTVFLGKNTGDSDAYQVNLNRLSHALAHCMLDESRGALAERILAEIRSFQRFHPNSFEQELDSMRHLAQHLVVGVGPHLTIDAITEAFAVRSKRLVTPESIEAYLVGAETAEERIDRLVELEENVVGAQSKKAVAGFMMPILSSPKTELQIGGEGKPVTARLRRVTEFQAAIKATHFDEMDKREILKSLDLLGSRIAERWGFFKSIEQRPVSTAEKTLALLRLIAHDVIPDGECAMRANALVTALVRRSDFMPTLMPDELPESDRQARLAEFKTLYDQAGLNKKPEEEPAPAIVPPVSAESAA